MAFARPFYLATLVPILKMHHNFIYFPFIVKNILNQPGAVSNFYDNIAYSYTLFVGCELFYWLKINIMLFIDYFRQVHSFVLKMNLNGMVSLWKVILKRF